MTIHRLGLVVHGGKPAAHAAAALARDWATRHGIPVTDVDVWDDADGHPRLGARDEAAQAGDPDLIVTIGGDGTFLRGVRVATSIDAAVLGVDLGRVGFLTEVTVEGMQHALDTVHAGGAVVEERMTLTMRASRPLEMPTELSTLLRYGRGPALPPPKKRAGLPDQVGWGIPLDVTAINDVVFEKLSRDRQASLAVYVGTELFASYSADALIVSTPTGSTAYSFAAGGPVISPRLDALVFTPVAPHMLFDRSLVLAADDMVFVRVLERSGQVAVSVDGQLRGVLDPGDWISVYAGAHRARLLRLGPPDFLYRLRCRFGLRDAPAAAADGSPPPFYWPDEPLPPDIADLDLHPPHEHAD